MSYPPDPVEIGMRSSPSRAPVRTAEPEKFRKRPVVIEAMHYDGSPASQSAIVTWTHGVAEGFFDGEYHLVIHTLEGPMRASVGDWVIRGVAGEFYACKPDIFEATYEPAEASS